MSRIKFRAWCKDRGMSEPFNPFQDILVYFKCTFKTYHLGAVKIHTTARDKHLKWLEFTGLQDREGVDIYEGDILQDAVGRVWLVDYHEKWGSFVFYWKGDKSHMQSYTRFHSNQKPLEVIGNIYEHPELLQEQGNA